MHFRPVLAGPAGITVLVLGLALSLSTAAADDFVSTSAETARLNEWLDARYEEELALSPTHLTQLGRKEHYGEIDDFSEAGELAVYQLLEQSTAQLQRLFDYEKLTPEGRISYDYWIYRREIFRQSLPFLRHRYQFTSEGGTHSFLPSFLIDMHTVDTRQEMLDYIARIKEASRALRQSLERAQQAAAEGIRPPRFAHETVIAVAGKVIAGEPFSEGPADSPLWADANDKISSLLERGIVDPATARSLREETRAALRHSLLPAYQDLIAWLRADLPNTSPDPKGVSSLPNGTAYYNHCLAEYTTTGLTAEEIYQLGLVEVARIRKQIQALMDKVEFRGGVDAFFQFVRTDPRFYFSNDNAGREAYMALTRRHLDTMNSRLPDYFGILPRGNLVIKRVPPFMEQDGMSPFYIKGTASGSRPGTYYLHLSDMSGLNITDLETTAYHEGIPGHHLESSIAQEQAGLPLFRNDLWYSAYSEGWALYAEYLAGAMGAFEDPYSDFGRLSAELWRAARLVVDTGLHARGWREQEAVDYMLANTALPKVTVRSEIRRYLSDPGQATSYKVGMLKLLDLRERAKRVLGERFDIRSFHDAVLGGGSLPLPILERRVNDWMISQSQAVAGRAKGQH